MMTAEARISDMIDARLGLKLPPDYEPYPHQWRFHMDPAMFRLLGGAAGGAKTWAQVAEAYRLAWSMPGSDGYVFREDGVQLKQSWISEALKLWPADEFRYNDTERKATFVNGSTVRFRHLLTEQAPYSYKSTQMDWLCVDELTELAFDRWWYLVSRLRTTKAGWEPRMFAGTNPGGRSHHEVKALWIDRDESFARDHRIDLNQFSFTPSLVTDNTALCARDPGYVSRLETLPDDEAKALRWGLWDVFKGQFFKAWRADVHVVEPFTIPADWPRYRGIDAGSTAPFCCLWGALDGRTDPATLYIYREHYEREWLLRDHAAAIVAASDGESYRASVGDPAMWSKTEADRTSWASQLSAEGLRLTPADNDRLAGWQLLKRDLQHSDEKPPALKVFSTCHNLIRTLPALQHDKRRVEDLNTSDEDHAADALRYLRMAIAGRMGTEPREAMTASTREAVSRGSRWAQGI